MTSMSKKYLNINFNHSTTYRTHTVVLVHTVGITLSNHCLINGDITEITQTKVAESIKDSAILMQLNKSLSAK